MGVSEIICHHVLLQNNVLELWSLFDFLMPGFLGTEKQFYERYGKPIIQSRDAKSSSKEQEAGWSIIIIHNSIIIILIPCSRYFSRGIITCICGFWPTNNFCNITVAPSAKI